MSCWCEPVLVNVAPDPPPPVQLEGLAPCPRRVRHGEWGVGVLPGPLCWVGRPRLWSRTGFSVEELGAGLWGQRWAEGASLLGLECEGGEPDRLELWKVTCLLGESVWEPSGTGWCLPTLLPPPRAGPSATLQ